MAVAVSSVRRADGVPEREERGISIAGLGVAASDAVAE